MSESGAFAPISDFGYLDVPFRLCNVTKLKHYWSSLNYIYSSPINAVQSLGYTQTIQSSRPLMQDYEPLLTRPLAD